MAIEIYRCINDECDYIKKLIAVAPLTDRDAVQVMVQRMNKEAAEAFAPYTFFYNVTDVLILDMKEQNEIQRI